MPHYMLPFNGILNVPVLKDSDVEKKEKLEKYSPFVESFSRQLTGNFGKELRGRFKIVVKLVLGGDYLGDHLSVSLAMKGQVITGYMTQDELSFWRTQLFVLDEVLLGFNELPKDDLLKKITERFEKVLAITKIFNESIKGIPVEL